MFRSMDMKILSGRSLRARASKITNRIITSGPQVSTHVLAAFSRKR